MRGNLLSVPTILAGIVAFTNKLQNYLRFQQTWLGCDVGTPLIVMHKLCYYIQ